MKISKTAIFLFELMFVILIFTISAAICTNIFAEAHKISSDSKELTMAVLEAESAAENYKANVFAGTSSADGSGDSGVITGFDQDWNETTDTDKAYYTVFLEPVSAKNGLQTATVSVVKSGDASKKSIYSLVVSAYGGK